MTLTTQIRSRLGDLTFRMFQVFRIARHLGIPFDNVVFNQDDPFVGYGINNFKYIDTGLFCIPDYLEYNKEWFKNLSGNFKCQNEYCSIVKDKIDIRNEDIWAINKDDFNGKTINVIDLHVSRIFNSSEFVDLDLFKDLFFDQNLLERNKDSYPHLQDRMCIHVRRTDYLDSDKFRRFVFSKHEILNAIETECQSGNNRFIICSDDIDWCIDNISLPKADIVFHSPDLKSYNDLYLMASCKKILSNGSFFGLTARYLHQIVLQNEV